MLNILRVSGIERMIAMISVCYSFGSSLSFRWQHGQLVNPFSCVSRSVIGLAQSGISTVHLPQPFTSHGQ